METRRQYGDGVPGRRGSLGVTDPSHPGRGRGAEERRSLGRLFGDLTGQLQSLVRLEVQLAKTELVAEVTQAGKGIGLMAGAGALAYAALLAFIASVALLLASFMPDWLGFLIAGMLVGVVSFIFLNAGRKALKEADFKLDRTSRTLEEDALWMRQEAEEIKRDPAHMGSTRLRR